MAIGDKIFLADKATLDTVSTNVTEANTNINTTNTRLGNPADAAGTSSVFSYLKSILNKVPNNTGSSRDYFTATDLAEGKLKIGYDVLNQSNRTILNLSNSGIVYAVAIYIPMNAQTGDVLSYSIHIDNRSIVSRSFTHAQYAQNTLSGYISKDSLLILPSIVAMPGIPPIAANPNSVAIYPGTTTSNLTASGTDLFYTPKPIRFSSNLTIVGSSSQGTARVCYMYELD